MSGFNTVRYAGMMCLTYLTADLDHQKLLVHQLNELQLSLFASSFRHITKSRSTIETREKLSQLVDEKRKKSMRSFRQLLLNQEIPVSPVTLAKATVCMAMVCRYRRCANHPIVAAAWALPRDRPIPRVLASRRSLASHFCIFDSLLRL